MAKVVDDQCNLVMHGILSLQRQQAHDSVEDVARLKSKEKKSHNISRKDAAVAYLG